MTVFIGGYTDYYAERSEVKLLSQLSFVCFFISLAGAARGFNVRLNSYYILQFQLASTAVLLFEDLPHIYIYIYKG